MCPNGGLRPNKANRSPQKKDGQKKKKNLATTIWPRSTLAPETTTQVIYSDLNKVRNTDLTQILPMKPRGEKEKETTQPLRKK